MFADISENLPKSLKCSDFVYKIKLLLKFPGGAKALLEINYKYLYWFNLCIESKRRLFMSKN